MQIAPFALSLSRMILRALIRRQVAKALPRVFRMLDQSVPKALQQQVAPVIIEGLIVDAVTKATGIRPTLQEVQAVAGLFDPLLAAVPISKRQK
jgi:hypothetical protein